MECFSVAISNHHFYIKLFNIITSLLISLILILTPFIAAQDRIVKLGQFTFPTERVFDIWGCYDSITDKEYAITGTALGVYITDVSNVYQPEQAAFLSGFPGFDVKIWKHYLYGVTGGEGLNEGKIADISDPFNPQIVSSFNSAHNIFISENGYLFAEHPGLIIYNLNTDPLNPVKVWEYESMQGHDAALIGSRLYDFHGGLGTNIYEVSFNPSLTLNLLSTIDDQIKYHHSGWATEDGNYLFICDEGAVNPDPDITVWDITNPMTPIKVEEYGDPDATVHNLFIIGNYAFTSYYTSGLRIFDVANPTDIKVTAEFDTNPFSGENFKGAFGVYPFTKSGNVYISDGTGLYIFSFDSTIADLKENSFPKNFQLLQNYPNPFNSITQIEYSLKTESLVEIRIYDILGKSIKELVSSRQLAGTYNLEFTATNLPTGIYFCRMQVSDSENIIFSEIKKLILLK